MVAESVENECILALWFEILQKKRCSKGVDRDRVVMAS